MIQMSKGRHPLNLIKFEGHLSRQNSNWYDRSVMNGTRQSNRSSPDLQLNLGESTPNYLHGNTSWKPICGDVYIDGGIRMYTSGLGE